jgi:hypothetical protein
VTLYVTQQPDLTATSGGPITVALGNTINMTGTIYNQGTGSTGAGFNNEWQITQSDQATVVDNRNSYVGTLGPGASSPTSVQSSYTFPSVGTYYYRVCADNNYSAGGGWAGSITESNENNNCSGWSAITVQSADLTVTSVQNATAALGQPITVTATIYNQGNAATTAGFNDLFVTNLNAQGTAWNTLQSTSEGVLAAGASQQVQLTFPASTFTSPGSYIWDACANRNTGWGTSVTDSNYNNDCGAGATITITAPDLTAAAGSAVSTTPGQSYTFTGTVSNVGTGSTSGGFWNLLQICSTAGPCNTYNDAGQESWVGTLASGAYSGVSITDTAPSTAGSYYYRICANNNTGWANTVIESNYRNDCSGWQTLTVSYPAIGGSCSVSPSSGYTSGTYTWTAYPSGGNGSYTYQWGGNVSGTSQTESQTYSAGSYSGQVTITSAGSSNIIYCSPGGSANPLVVTQPAAPSCSASPTNPLVNQTVTYTATPGAGDNGSYTWTPSLPSACTSTSGATETCTFSTIGPYSMSVASTNGSPTTYCSNETVGCSGTPTPSISASAARVNQGSAVTLTFSGSNVNYSCSLTANGVAVSKQSYTPNSCTVSQHTYSTSVSEQTKYCYVCDGTPACTIVNVIPNFNEF